MSTFANFSIQDRDRLKSFILHKLGAPLLTIELTDEQLDFCIDEATEVFTKYAVQDQRFMIVNLDNYVEDVGITLQSDVISIFSLSNDRYGFGDYGLGGGFFAIDNSMMMSLMGPIMPAMRNFSFVTFEIAHQYLDMVRMMLGAQFDFNFNERTKNLVLYPDPKKAGLTNMSIIIGVHVVRPEEQLYGEDWIKRMGLACAKMLLGTVRKKFSSVQLIGGGNIDATIGDEGKEEYNALREELQSKEGPPLAFFVS